MKDLKTDVPYRQGEIIVKDDKKTKEILRNLSMITQLGLSVMTPILLCVVGAGYIDRRFDTGSWVLIPGIVIGAGAGMLSMIKIGKMMSKKK